VYKRQALEAAAARAEALATEALEPALKAALEARLRALLEAPEAATPATVRARAKATPVEAPVPEAEAPEATATKAPRRRAKAKAPTTAPEADMATLMEGVGVALAKYKGLSTPKGKPLEEVLARRVRRVLQYAEVLGRDDLPALARSAIAVIGTNPMGYAMGAWPALAVALGLPDPIQAKVVGE
jgi:hypothetical protein